MSEQKQTTAQEILISFGARFNAEAVRLGDMIHNAIEQLQKDNAALRARIEALESAEPEE